MNSSRGNKKQNLVQDRYHRGEDLFGVPRSGSFRIGVVLGEALPEYAHPEPVFCDFVSGIRLYEGDALELLKRCRSELFDLIFADPPYFLSDDGITCYAGQMVSVNKGHWDKAKPFEEIHEFNLAWLSECKRTLKPNGTIFVSGTYHNIYSVGFAMQQLGYVILNDIAWFKVNPPPNLSCRYFTHATETILWAKKSKKARHYFNYEAMKAMPDPAPGKQMLSLWHILPPKPHEKRYGKHPTQKPEALLERIIQSASKPGDLVLDPFLGSGTTGVVAARLKRRFVGFEIEGKFLKIAIKRISDELNAQQKDLWEDTPGDRK
jgi:site-specific DNA-methyltransferase (adenine-specific)